MQVQKLLSQNTMPLKQCLLYIMFYDKICDTQKAGFACISSFIPSMVRFKICLVHLNLYCTKYYSNSGTLINETKTACTVTHVSFAV